jgi:hypothetical protein
VGGGACPPGRGGRNERRRKSVESISRAEFFFTKGRSEKSLRGRGLVNVFDRYSAFFGLQTIDLYNCEPVHIPFATPNPFALKSSASFLAVRSALSNVMGFECS